MKWPPAVNNRCSEITRYEPQGMLHRTDSPLCQLRLPFTRCPSNLHFVHRQDQVVCLPFTSLRVPIRPANQAGTPGLSPPAVTSCIMFPWRGINGEENTDGALEQNAPCSNLCLQSSVGSINCQQMQFVKRFTPPAAQKNAASGV